MKYKLMLGDNMELLKKIPDNSIDSVVTDPPYGLSFMNKHWDYDVPTVEFWKEVYRVLKPGGHVLSFGGTRTYHRMVVNCEDAGFEVRDCISWLYGSGFPKSLNIGKEYDKKVGNDREVVGIEKQNNFDKYAYSMMTKENRDIDTELYKEIKITKGTSPYEGWGTALKPAQELILLARKPLSEKTIVDNVVKWGTGGINIDGCRIGSEKHIVIGTNISGSIEDQFKRSGDERNYDGMNKEVEGRFPANLILECICDEVIKGNPIDRTTTTTNINNKEANWFRNAGGDKEDRWDYNDTGDIHTNPDCPCYMLDKQSGVSESSKSKKQYNNVLYNDIAVNYGGGQRSPGSTYGDKGGASRFFYVAKVSKKERNLGLDGFEEKQMDLSRKEGNPGGDNPRNRGVNKRVNNHPTLKPINLLTYLCRMITPENGIVLDPFMGSGSTGISALLEGFRFCGMEMDQDYFKIAEARISSFEEYRKLMK